MSKTITRLFPTPSQEIELKGLYLSQRLHQIGSPENPFVYANFLTSLDGRIAVTDPHTGETSTPETLTSKSDFRLFMELHAQADCLITHSGYLRSLATKKLGNILQVGTRPNNEDLSHWRQANGLTAQPALVIASASLDFPIPDSLKQNQQQVYIATGNRADPERIAYWQDQGYRVLLTGADKRVQGQALIEALGAHGYQTIYLIAGPEMLDTMLRERQLSRLYQTITHQLIGGGKFHSLIPGLSLGEFGNLKLSSLLYNANEPSATGQFFCQFNSG
jgi:riboflavin biosynthesis pyrimidine reductase